jgi:hypothetical protein
MVIFFDYDEFVVLIATYVQRYFYLVYNIFGGNKMHYDEQFELNLPNTEDILLSTIHHHPVDVYVTN